MSVHFDSVTCTSVSGTFDGDTGAVVSCYFEPVGGGPHYAGVVSNNDPVPGAWTAADFAAKPSQASYNLFAAGDDDPQHPTEADPISC